MPGDIGSMGVHSYTTDGCDMVWDGNEGASQMSVSNYSASMLDAAEHDYELVSLSP